MADGADGGASLAVLRRRVFGDGTGEVLFLGALVVTWATWQVGFFITDTYAVANTLVNVAQGHVHIDHLQYSLTLDAQPGLHVVDGQLYGRNYGQAVLSLPAYYGLEAASVVVDTRLLLPGLWSLLVVAFTRRLAGLFDRPRIATAGALLAAGLFVVNTALARQFSDEMTGILALQLTATVAVAVTAVFVYRLLDRTVDGRVAATAGAVTVLATPLWFWAPIPKRHVLTAAAVTLVLFAFAASREPDAARRRLSLRAFGYLVCGTLAWVHVFEGFVVLGLFLVADVATARSNGWRELAALGLVLVLAFAPFMATNVAISGNPLESPRMTTPFDTDDHDVRLGPGGSVITGDPTDVAPATETPSGQTPGESTGTPSGQTPGESTGAPADRTPGDSSSGDQSGKSGDQSGKSGGATDGDDTSGDGLRITEVIGGTVRTGGSYLLQTVRAFESAPSRLYHTYLRSGHNEIVRYGVNQQEPVDLTLLESMPIVGVLLVSLVGVLRGGAGRVRASLVALRSAAGRAVRGTRAEPSTLVHRARERLGRLRRADPDRQAAVLAVGIAVAFATMYLSYLPRHSQVTVRYVVPMMPALVYLVGRSGPVRRTVRNAFGPLVASYAGFVAVGLALVVVGFPPLHLAIGEAMQLHALVNIGAALVAAAVLGARTLNVGVGDRLAAAGLAMPLAATTVLLVAMQLAYFEYGTQLLPAVRVLAESVAVLS